MGAQLAEREECRCDAIIEIRSVSIEVREIHRQGSQVIVRHLQENLELTEPENA